MNYNNLATITEDWLLKKQQQRKKQKTKNPHKTISHIQKHFLENTN